MSQGELGDNKKAALRRISGLHPDPEDVVDESFLRNGFFDPRDLVQVKYEMLRRVHIEGQSVTRVAAAFGFSRAAYYQAQSAFEQGGVPGLVPHKRGPRQPRKVTPQIMTFVRETQALNPAASAAYLARSVQDRFGVIIHPRSIRRYLVFARRTGTNG